MEEKKTGKCLYKYETLLPPCIVLRVKKYSYLKDFLEDNEKKTNDLSVALKIDCIEFKGDHIDIKNENCINCMYCVFGCPGNNIEIKSDYSLRAMCSNFGIEYDDKLNSNVLDKLFNGEFIKLPVIRLNQFKVKYKSFDDFTSKDETTNISVWGANILKFLSTNINPRLGLEIGMKIKTRDRGGRLDICLLNDNTLFVAEAKVSFDKMMTENRYISQMVAYEEEILSSIENINLKHYKFLLIGGDETDLLPITHADCTSKVGYRAETFYNSLVDNKLLFFSANALLVLSLLKLFYGDKYSIENIFSKNINENIVGVLSSGFVVKNGNNYTIKNIII
jgi:ferredoxin